MKDCFVNRMATQIDSRVYGSLDGLPLPRLPVPWFTILNGKSTLSIPAHVTGSLHVIAVVVPPSSLVLPNYDMEETQG